MVGMMVALLPIQMIETIIGFYTISSAPFPIRPIIALSAVKIPWDDSFNMGC